MKMFIEGKDRRIAYFIPLDGHTDAGWKVGIAAEGLPHYYGTDWYWDCSYEDAVKLAQEVNDERGISEEEAKEIIHNSVLASFAKEVS